MLHYLKIKNLALMEEVELDFEAGFNVITGETGAGKSILIGALNILSGARMPKTCVRKGTDLCEVEAIIGIKDNTKVNEVLKRLEMPECDDDSLVIYRSVSLIKPGKILINGKLATLTQLAELGESWIDFHGPGEPQKLFHESYQLELLDEYAGLSNLKCEYLEKFNCWKKQLAEIESLKTEEKMSSDEIAFFQAQIDNMEKIDLSDEGIELLENNYKKLSYAQELSAIIQNIDDSFGENGLMAVMPKILKNADALESIIPNDARLLNERLNSLMIEIEDLHSEYINLIHDTNDDFNTEELSEKMDKWLDLKRKYGPTPENVRIKKDFLIKKLAKQGNIEDFLIKAYEKAEDTKKELLSIAKKMHEKRSVSAKKWLSEAQKILVELGFKKADLIAELQFNDTNIIETGCTSCQFLFSPNLGQDVLPLNKIASSGETARVMLALKTILAEADKTPVLVFDEVDANVGGEVAVHLAKKLSEIAKTHQVFCITHLPQVAAIGNFHFCVTKSQDVNTTHIDILRIDNLKTKRIEELARMLGDRNSAAALQHAKTLLKSI